MTLTTVPEQVNNDMVNPRHDCLYPPQQSSGYLPRVNYPPPPLQQVGNQPGPATFATQQPQSVVATASDMKQELQRQREAALQFSRSRARQLRLMCKSQQRANLEGQMHSSYLGAYGYRQGQHWQLSPVSSSAEHMQACTPVTQMMAQQPEPFCPSAPLSLTGSLLTSSFHQGSGPKDFDKSQYSSHQRAMQQQRLRTSCLHPRGGEMSLQPPAPGPLQATVTSGNHWRYTQPQQHQHLSQPRPETHVQLPLPNFASMRGQQDLSSARSAHTQRENNLPGPNLYFPFGHDHCQ